MLYIYVTYTYIYIYIYIHTHTYTLIYIYIYIYIQQFNNVILENKLKEQCMWREQLHNIFF